MTQTRSIGGELWATFPAVGVITDYFAADDRELRQMDFTVSPVTFDSPAGVSAKAIDDKVMLGQLESVMVTAPVDAIGHPAQR